MIIVINFTAFYPTYPKPMTYCEKAIALVLLLLTIQPLCTSGQEIESFNLEFYVNWLRDPQKKLIPETPIRELSRKEHLALSEIIKDNMKDSIFDVRWKSISLGSKIGSSSKSEQVRKEVISIMLQMMYDSDSRIIYFASQNLKELEYSRYTSSQKDTILDIITKINNPSVLVTLYRICGEQSITESVVFLEEIGFSSNVPFYQRWVALSSLTRLGHEKAEDAMYSYLSGMDISLDAINMLYPYILFSRSTKNVDYLIDLILNNDSGCESSNPNVTTTIPCAYLVLAVVAPEILGVKWEGEDGLQSLKPEEALKKARHFFKNTDNNWSFVSE